LETTVRANGAVPATIAAIGGRIQVGLPDEDLDRLGTAEDVLKLSRPDLP
jgi:pseudouridine-5'-phosphate glycosidase